jgi:hypothetical protein
LPGAYQLKATAKTELASLETEEEAELAGEKKGKVSVDLSLKGEYVIIESDELEADVYVNGKKKGVLKQGIYNLGPVSTDSSVEVHLEKHYDWGKAKTKSVKIGESSSYYLTFPEQVTASDVSSFLENHLDVTIRAVNLNDFSLVENDYDKSGKAYEEERKYIKYLNEKKITESLVKFEVRDVQRVNETQFKVKTYEEFNIYYGDGSAKFKTFANEYLVTVFPDGKIGMHSLVSNETLKSEDLHGPTEGQD